MKLQFIVTIKNRAAKIGQAMMTGLTSSYGTV